MNVPRHFLRIGSHAEKEYFLGQQDTYDGVIINANLVVSTLSASASLIKALGKPYVIDPWTFVYGLRPALLKVEKLDKKKKTKTYEVKPAYRKLADRYTIPADCRVGETPVTPAAFSSEPVLEAFCKGALEFQMSCLKEGFEDDDVFGDDEELLPCAVLAPYFYIPDKDWAHLNRRLILKSLSILQDRTVPLFGVVCCSMELLRDRDLFNEITSQFADLNVDGFFFWVSGMDEHSLGLTEIRSLVDLISVLSNHGKRAVVNMYGGYFSAALVHLGLSSFSHGVGYGEDKEVEPVIGGLPSARFYVPPLHDRFVFSEVSLMLAQISVPEYYRTVCDCEVCKREVRSNMDNFKIRFLEMQKSPKAAPGSRFEDRLYPTGSAQRLCREHFLEARKREVDEVDSKTVEQIASGLRSSFSQYVGRVGIPSINYLSKWALALTS